VNMKMGKSFKFIEAKFNATVQATFLDDGGVEVPGDYTSPGLNDTFDYARFSVEIASLKNPQINYLLAYNQTRFLGDDGAGDSDNYTDTPMTNNVDEFVLKSLLESVLSDDGYNFTVILGIDIICTDNDNSSDEDYFEKLLIRSLNLTFTYEKTIDQLTFSQLTSVSWNQDGNKLSDLSPENDTTVIATAANLKFKYKIDKDWYNSTSPLNSEINIYLNGNPYPIPIKLIDVNTTVCNANIDDLTPPVDSVNLSIQVQIRDTFNLHRTITISIDDVELFISYTIFNITLSVLSGGDGGGGGTTIIRGEDYTPVVIGLIAGIVALVGIFAAYQLHYKYPPLIRKINKLQKNMQKGKATKPMLLNTREEFIKKRFKIETQQILERESVHSEIPDKSDKLNTVSKVNKNKKVENGGS